MAVKNLPQQYKRKEVLDLQKDRKLAVIINLAAVFLFVLFIGGLAAVAVIKENVSFTIHFFTLITFVIGVIGILIVHELLHGLFFKLFCRDKIRYGITLQYAYAGCPDWYFCKKEYLIAALAPFVLLNLLLVFILMLLKGGMFAAFYIIFSMHFAGCAGDLYVVFKLLRYPPDTLIRDTGMAMQFFIRGK